MKQRWLRMVAVGVVLLAGAVGVRGLWAQEGAERGEAATGEASVWSGLSSWAEDVPLEIHGFWDTRAGGRFLNDPHEKDMSVMESRVQLDFFASLETVDLKYKADVYGDFVTEDVHYDMREGNVFIPLETMDIKVGRQVLTWGTGDLVFINDLFPKDWVSFFIGRDTEYLKAAVGCGEGELVPRLGECGRGVYAAV